MSNIKPTLAECLTTRPAGVNITYIYALVFEEYT